MFKFFGQDELIKKFTQLLGLINFPLKKYYGVDVKLKSTFDQHFN